MAKSLILVESPQKLATLSAYFDESIDIVNVNGSGELMQHLLFNDPPTLALLSESSLAALAKKTQECQTVYYGMSPDFTGDALAGLLSSSLNLNNGQAARLALPVLAKKQVRQSLSEAPKNAVTRGNLLQDAIQLDATFDYYARQLLGVKKAGQPLFGLAAGVALKILCEFAAADSAQPEPEPVLCAIFPHGGEKKRAVLQSVNDQPPELRNKHVVQALLIDLKEQTFRIERVVDKSGATAPPLPLTTAKLCAAAQRYLGLRPRQTLDIARSLYDGCEAGLKQPVGLITYPITDSLYIPQEDIMAAREFILVNYGKNYLPEKPRHYAQADTHFSVIRPTALVRTPKKMKKYLSDDQLQVYDLIWRRFLAAQMTDAVFTQRQITLTAGPKKRYVFKMEQSQTASRGYLQLFPDAANAASEVFTQELRKGAEFKPFSFELSQENPPRDFYYTDGRLVEALGDLGVCFAEILEYVPEILRAWKFVKESDGRLLPTRAGKSAFDMLWAKYPDILNERFVRQMKKKLIRQADDRKKTADAVAGPVADLVKLLEHPTRPNQPVDFQAEAGRKTRKKCPLCGGNLVEKSHGDETFLVCEKYPDGCQYHKSIAAAEKRYYGQCDKCGAELVVRAGRYGRFLACSTFPRCDFTRPYTIGAKCPLDGCGGDVIERFTKNGRLFYGCSLYPACKFSSWQMPVNVACPKCGSLYLVAKTGEALDAYNCPKCKTEFDAQLSER